MNSKLFSLNLKDLAHGTIVTGGSAIFAAAYQGVTAGNLDPHFIISTGIIAGAGYLFKKIFTNSNGDILKKD